MVTFYSLPSTDKLFETDKFISVNDIAYVSNSKFTIFTKNKFTIFGKDGKIIIDKDVKYENESTSQ
jgi:hypothetical protein